MPAARDSLENLIEIGPLSGESLRHRIGVADGAPEGPAL
jgi:hypothetical protein